MRTVAITAVYDGGAMTGVVVWDRDNRSVFVPTNEIEPLREALALLKALSDRKEAK